MLTRDDWNVYSLGSDYWSGVGDRILVAGVNDKEFFEDLFEGKSGKSFKKRLDCVENRATLFTTYQGMYPNQPIVRSKLGDVLHKLMLSYTFIDPHAEPEEPEDTRPRDALGRVMSAKAIQWQQWEAWCNNPETSTRQINEMRRTDPGFAEFYATTAERERLTDDPMATTNTAANYRQQDSKKKVSDAVQQFAAEYRTMPTEKLKSLLSPGRNPLGPADAARVQSLYDAALAAGLI